MLTHDEQLDLDFGSELELELQPENENDNNNNNNNDDEDVQEYVVEAIMEHFIDKGRAYYLVKWEGYQDSHDWLSEEDLQGAPELLAEYHARNRKRLRQEGKPVGFFQ